MGLDAVVYCSCVRKNKSESDYASLFKIDIETGEAYLPDNTILDLKAKEEICPHEDFTALHRRLGNIFMIGECRNYVSSIAGTENSILLNNVLYSGSHAGDFISLEQLPSLKQEIDGILEIASDSIPDLVILLFEDLKELIKAAENEQNPIVF